MPGAGKPAAATEVTDVAPEPTVNGWNIAVCVDEATLAAAHVRTNEDASGQVSHAGMKDITNVSSKGVLRGQRRRTSEAVGRPSDMERNGNKRPVQVC